MQDENNENIDSLNDEDTLIEEEIEIDEEETPEPDENELLRQENEKLKLTNQKLYARVKKDKPLQTTGNKTTDADRRIAQLELAEKKRQFGYENNLSPSETDALFRVSPNPTKEDLNNPFIKGGIDALRKKARVENNTPNPSSHSRTVDGKNWDEMSKDDRVKNFEKHAQNFQK